MTRLAIAALLAALASPAVAQAEPQYPDRYDPYDRSSGRYDRPRPADRYDRYDRGVVYPRDRYDRWDRSRWYHGYRGRWVPLAQRLSTRTPQQHLDLGRGAGRFRALRIEAERGAPAIRGLYIQYQNGRYHWVDLGRRLRPGAGEVIDLRGNARRIDRIIVYGDPRTRGTYSIFAG